MNKTMKLGSKVNMVLIGFLLFGLLVCSTGLVSAHSPSDMNLTYDRDAETLTVDITHSVSDTNTHYVETIQIRINDDVVVDDEYSSQPGNSFSYTFDSLQAEEGDEIQVSAICNLGGSIQRQLTVTAEGGTSAEDTPGFGLMVLIISLSIILLMTWRRTNT